MNDLLAFLIGFQICFGIIILGKAIYLRHLKKIAEKLKELEK